MVAAGANGARRWTRIRVARGDRNGARLAVGPNPMVVLRCCFRRGGSTAT